MLLLKLLFFVFHSGFHPIHISVCNMDFNPDANSLEVTHKIFLDDLELALEAYCGKKLQIGTRFEDPEAEKFLKAYIKESFELEIDGEAKKFDWVGSETDLEAMWIYIEFTDTVDPKAVNLTNSILTDLYDDQRNILHFKYQGLKKSFIFERGNTSNSFSIE